MPAIVFIGSVIMPAGKYYVGDPCYAVPDDRWMEWLKAAGVDDRWMEWLKAAGVDDQDPFPRYLVADLDGHPVLGIGTKYGDGEFPGNDGKYYPVDAGLLGVVPVEVADITGYANMVPVEFPTDFQCTWDDSGAITLGHIEIATDPDLPDPDFPAWMGEDD